MASKKTVPDTPAPQDATDRPESGSGPPTERPPLKPAADPRKQLAVSADRLKWTVDPAEIPFETTDSLPYLPRIDVQDRALEAMRLGASIDLPGYNTVCLGLIGEDRLKTVKTVLAELPKRRLPVQDHCYVMNFREPSAPQLLTLPPGTATDFAAEVDDLIDQLKKHLRLVFEADGYGERLQAIADHHESAERELLSQLRLEATHAGFTVSQVQTELGTSIDLLFRVAEHLFALDDLEAAVHDAQAGMAPGFEVEVDDIEDLNKALASVDVAAVRAAHEPLAELLRASMRKARDHQRAARREQASLEREESLIVIEGAIAELAHWHADIADISTFMHALKSDVLRHLGLFKSAAEAGPEQQAAGREVDVSKPKSFQDLRERYRVNVIADNASREGCPCLIESVPSIRNLFGAIRKSADSLGGQVDHRGIRTGSLLAANGGFLILDCADVLAEPDAWRALKRVLLTRQLDPRESMLDRDQSAGPLLRPQSIPLSTKVILVGDEHNYEYLHSMDADFQHAFKVRAEFDWLIDRGPEAIKHLGLHARRLSEEEGLRACDRSAMAALVEHAARLAEDGNKMISRFEELSDVIRQADYRAGKDGSALITASQIEGALAAAEYRCSLGAERVQDALKEGRILISTKGTQVGELNALAVRSTIEHSFGYPVRMTAVVSHGSAGVINIEREVKMSGHLHDKGMFIVQGFLAGKYGHLGPLTFTASVAFEQLYGGIDGDSASAAEILILLSAMTRIPIEQGIAVTGSVNQLGEIQPVGGVNEKIEGYFEACVGLAGSIADLPGTQGVVIPESNVSDLMLRPRVVEAAREGRFHVWAMSTIDEGLELITGVAAGQEDDYGLYPEGTVHRVAADCLAFLGRNPQGPEPPPVEKQ